MSLILGIPLSNRIYLVSDSRVTEGSSHKDNCAKWNNLNARLCVLGAGHLQFASFLIRKIRENVKEDDSFHELDVLLKEKLYTFAQDFYAQTGSYSFNVALIFGGYDPTLKRKTTAGRFGEVIANPLVRRGDGNAMEQQVDLKYFDAMRAHFGKDTEEMLRGDTVLEIDAPRPRCVAVRMYMPDPQSSKVLVEWEEADLWESISFHPDWVADRVRLPIELIADLDFGESVEDETKEQQAYKAHERIVNSIQKILHKRSYDSVGGNIVPVLITEDSDMAIATGSLAKKNNPAQIIGGLQVINGKLHYFDQNGELHPYEHIIDLPEGKISPKALI